MVYDQFEQTQKHETDGKSDQADSPLSYHEIMRDCQTPAQKKEMDIGKEAEKIVALLDENKTSKAAETLSRDLLRLQGEKYNELLFSVYATHKNGGGAQLNLEDFNPKTQTWDKVTLASGPNPDNDIYDYYRIVQPGNTLSKYAVEKLGLDATRQNIKDWTQFIAEMNKIVNPDHILVGQAIRLGVFYD